MSVVTSTVKWAMVAAMLVAFVGARHAAAQEAGRAPSGSLQINASTAQTALLAATNHVLKQNYMSSGTLAGAFFPAFTYSAVDSAQTIICPGTTGTCTIQADHWIEMNGSSTGNEAWACLAVDGVLDDFCGFFDNKIPPDGGWVQATSSHAKSGVPVGTHTIQTFANSTFGVHVAYFNVNYRVFKP